MYQNGYGKRLLSAWTCAKRHSAGTLRVISAWLNVTPESLAKAMRSDPVIMGSSSGAGSGPVVEAGL
jgi:uncharacterized membrane protein